MAAPTGPDEYIGSAEGKDKDRWTYYDDPKRGRTYGWDVGGAHKVKHSGGALSAAVFAVSNVEGTYDNVQTYDSAVLTFGIMQWTVHAGSLQRFLGYLKEGAGPEARAAFDQHLGAHGIDVKKQGQNYELSYKGVTCTGAEQFNKLIRSSKAGARRWVDWFHAAGVDPRVQKAEFEHAKQQFVETRGTKLESFVPSALKKCSKTFFAKYRGSYGAAGEWTGLSEKAAVLHFSMVINNPTYGNAALLKAIDAHYDAHGVERATWPEDWPVAFGDLVEAKCRETLSNWGDRKDKNGRPVEGRVSKTLRFWNEALGKGAEQPGLDGATATTAPKPRVSSPKPTTSRPRTATAKAPASAAAAAARTTRPKRV